MLKNGPYLPLLIPPNAALTAYSPFTIRYSANSTECHWGTKSPYVIQLQSKVRRTELETPYSLASPVSRHSVVLRRLVLCRYHFSSLLQYHYYIAVLFYLARSPLSAPVSIILLSPPLYQCRRKYSTVQYSTVPNNQLLYLISAPVRYLGSPLRPFPLPNLL